MLDRMGPRSCLNLLPQSFQKVSEPPPSSHYLPVQHVDLTASHLADGKKRCQLTGLPVAFRKISEGGRDRIGSFGLPPLQPPATEAVTAERPKDGKQRPIRTLTSMIAAAADSRIQCHISSLKKITFILCLSVFNGLYFSAY